MKQNPAKYLLLIFVLFGQACSSWNLQSVEPTYYKIDTLAADSTIQGITLSYKQHIDSIMNEVLTELPVDLMKDNRTLGFWMADACRTSASKKAGIQVDVALLNKGGIRRPYLKKGPIALGMIYELMPFDNQMVLLKVKGSLLYEILQVAAEKGGEPISGSFVWVKANDSLNSIVNNLPLNDTLSYSLVTNDYMYNGGDGYALMQKAGKPIYLGLIRDALIEEISKTTTFPDKETLRWIWDEE